MSFVCYLNAPRLSGQSRRQVGAGGFRTGCYKNTGALTLPTIPGKKERLHGMGFFYIRCCGIGHSMVYWDKQNDPHT